MPRLFKQKVTAEMYDDLMLENMALKAANAKLKGGKPMNLKEHEKRINWLWLTVWLNRFMKKN